MSPARAARRRGRRWLLLGVLHVVLGLLLLSPSDNWVYDPSFYYGQLRSPLVDGDLDLSNETSPPHVTFTVTATGLQSSDWPIGPSVLWSPFFGLVHAPLLLLHPSAASGRSAPYIVAVSAGSLLLGLVGLGLCWRLWGLAAGPAAEGGPALLACGLTLLATPLLYYLYRQPIMAHSGSFLAAAALLLACLRIERGELTRWPGATVGALVGLNALVRWTSVLLVLVPLLLWAPRLWALLRRRDRPGLRRAGAQVLLAGLAALLVGLPQLAWWRQVHGQWLRVPSRSSFLPGLLPVNLDELLLHTNRGLIFWAPLVVFGGLGLLGLRPLRLRVAALVYLLAHLYVLGRWRDWYGGGGFGPRYFIETLPLLGMGLTLLIARMWRRPAGRWAVGLAGLVLVAHQQLLVQAVDHSWLDAAGYGAGQPLGLAWQGRLAARLATHPADLLQPRLATALDRQAPLVNLAGGIAEAGAYAITLPIIACVALGLGVAAGLAHRLPAWVWPAGLVALSLGWTGLLLATG